MSEIHHTSIPQNFVYPDLKDVHYRFGSGQITAEPLRPDADWRDYVPPDELQKLRGVESSACFIEAQQHCIASIEEETFGEIDNNYSARFNALLSDGTSQGGDPIAGADSIRHDGMVRDTSMPFGEYLTSWEEFHSWEGVDETKVRAEGKKYLEGKKLNHDVVIERHESIGAKYAKLREALKYCPCPISVTAWYEQGGLYFKPEGARDNHMVELLYIDPENHPYIRDTYFPFTKKLAPFYNFDFSMRWAVQKIEGKKKSGCLQNIKEYFADLFS